MLKTKNKYISRPSKLKRFAKKSLYRKVYPSFLRKDIPEDFLTIHGYTKEQLIKDVYRLMDCNQRMNFIHKTVIENNNHIKKIKLFEVNNCNIFTLCPICAEKISRRRREKYKNEIMDLAVKYDYVYMVTFTTRNADTFNESYLQLRKSLRKYILMGQLRGVSPSGEEIRSGTEISKIMAMAVSIEIKKGKNSKKWHVHGHAIVFCNERIDYQIYDTNKKLEIKAEFKDKFGHSPNPADLHPAVIKWGNIELVDNDGVVENHKIPVSKASAEWLYATGGMSSNIKFSPLKGTAKEIYNQCVEVIKYTSKVQSFSREDIVEILINRKGKRFFSTYGELYNKHSPKVSEDENILYVEGVTGYVWSEKEKDMIPLSGAEKSEIARRYENREKIKQAQGLIMKAYYEKESILKNIMRETMENQKRDNWTDYKKMVIKHINELESAYDYAKRKIYNNVMKTSYKVPEFMRPTPIQKMYTKRIENILEVV